MPSTNARIRPFFAGSALAKKGKRQSEKVKNMERGFRNQPAWSDNGNVIRRSRRNLRIPGFAICLLHLGY